MVELIIVAMLLAILATSALFAAPKYFSRRRDTTRKFDLNQMKVAFEDYSNDKTCYPDPDLLFNCGSNDLAPYMKKVTCDPGTDQPYEYVLSSDCRSYELYTTLENTDDKDITEVGCQNGCGPGGEYNYGIVGGGAVLDR